MVCGRFWASGAAVAPSSCELVWVRLRGMSIEPMLEDEWVRERTRRVMLAVGTERERERKY